MSHTALQKNLEVLIKKHNYQIAELERKAGLRKNNIYNVLKGITKKPSAESLQAVANVFEISVKDLFYEKDVNTSFLSIENLELLKQICNKTIDNILVQNLPISCDNLTEIMKEVFNYSYDNNLNEPDEKFIKWLIKYRIEQFT